MEWLLKCILHGNEHNPPHVHVIYGEYMSAIRVDTLEVLEGDLPNKALNLAKEWIELHRKEILEMWNNQTFKKINPLK